MCLEFLWTSINVMHLIHRTTLCASGLLRAGGRWHCTRFYSAVVNSELPFEDGVRMENRIDERTATNKQPLDFIHQWDDGCHSILHLKLFFPVDSQQAGSFAIIRWLIFQLFVGWVNLMLETLFFKAELTVSRRTSSSLDEGSYLFDYRAKRCFERYSRPQGEWTFDSCAVCISSFSVWIVEPSMKPVRWKSNFVLILAMSPWYSVQRSKTDSCRTDGILFNVCCLSSVIAQASCRIIKPKESRGIEGLIRIHLDMSQIPYLSLDNWKYVRQRNRALLSSGSRWLVSSQTSRIWTTIEQYSWEKHLSIGLYRSRIPVYPSQRICTIFRFDRYWMLIDLPRFGQLKLIWLFWTTVEISSIVLIWPHCARYAIFGGFPWSSLACGV